MARNKPLIVVVDDDAQVLKALRRDLRAHYQDRYEILDTTSAQEALESLVALRKSGDEVALYLSDQRMPEMLGVEFLSLARVEFPRAKRALLTAYSDTEAAIRAINEVQLDYYLVKPWDPPQERLYPVLDELLEEWEAGYIPPFDGIRVVGHSFSPKAHEIKSFLSGNLFPYRWLDAVKDAAGRELLELHESLESDLPLIVLDGGGVLRNPSVLELAQKLGLQPKPGHSTYDVAIIGAGPAGLAAAVYGASEGLETVLIEKKAPGGQAGTSSRIENYLGFPTGLSGSELSRRAVAQATRFGVELMSPNSVRALERQGEYHRLLLEDGSELNAKSIVIASGVDYRKLEADGLDRFLGAGVYYGAANTEAASCKGEDVYVVGGGNSAGQAAVYLSNFARKVGIVVRKPDLSSTMSAYLIKQIEGLPNVEVVPFTEVVRGEGGDRLERIELANRSEGGTRWVDAAGLFVFIGAKPYTDWLPDEISKDPRGFVYTGRDLVQQADFKLNWKQNREPYLLETSIPGVFAAGDVRSGAMNRVASAVGEGSMSIAMVHQYLAQF